MTDVDVTRAIRARLESLPIRPWHLAVFVICALSLLCDSADQFLIISIAPLLIREWGISSAQLGLVVAATGIGGVIGAPIFGALADRLGRRRCMMLSIAIYTLLTALAALSQNISQLLVIRARSGIGLGGIVPVTLAYVSEYSPPRWRGRVVAWWNSMFAFGIPLAGAVGLLVIVPYGWRWGFVIGALPIVLIAGIAWLPESVRYLLAKNRTEEALRTIARVERAVLGAAKPANAGASAPDATRGAVPAAAGPRAWRVLGLLNAPGMRVTMIASAVLWFLPASLLLSSFYGVFLTQAKGMDLRAAIALVTATSALGPLGQLFAGFSSNWVGRKATLTIALCLLGAMPLAAFDIAQSSGLVYLCLTLAWIGTSAIYGTAFGYTSEQLPTELRSGALGVFEGLRRLGGAVGPAMIGLLYGLFGLTPVLWIAASGCLLTIVVVLALGRETRGKPMTEMEHLVGTAG
ncbi:MAG TPA: MFS transporter [Stellaceae bacterium]|nr:MFS transporter [Stellaceae bacterium]